MACSGSKLANLDIYQGDDHAWTVKVQNEDGTDADITGYTAEAQVRRDVADVDAVVVTSMSVSVQSPLIFLSLSREQTKTMTGRYVWDLQITSPAGAISTILYGSLAVRNEVTRMPVAG